MEKEFNARCPNCGTEFVVEETGGKVMCPGCGEECSAVQAKKYYSTIHATKGEFKEAHGEEYHKEMMILDEVYGYIRLGDFENAEKVRAAFALKADKIPEKATKRWNLPIRIIKFLWRWLP